MMNFMDLGGGNLQMSFGILGGVSGYERYDTGELKNVRLSERNMLVTHAGELVPAYIETIRRKRKPSLEFYKNGLARSVCLEEQQEIVTPIGELPAEFLTFYETGELKRFFPLDGQLSGFWSLEEERALNIPLTFDLGWGEFTALLGGICFYPSGAIRSVTLFPGETLRLPTPAGELLTGVGFSLYESGALASAEPASPLPVVTPVGRLEAFDPNADGVNADLNSLRFDEKGRVTALTSATSRISVQTADGALTWYAPKTVPLTDDGSESVTYPLQFRFDYPLDQVAIHDGADHVFPISGSWFITARASAAPSCSPSDCASCSLCK